jgi:predicted RNA methylase
MAVGEKKIKNMESYNRAMSKSMIDKMFFMDKIDESVTTVFDYGCANGVLIGTLAGLFPDMTYVGYDLDEEMIRQAGERCAEYDNVFLFSSLESFHAWARERDLDFKKTALNLSSLIHEVYSYGTPESIEEFWRFVTGSGFGYIVIRDMCLDCSANRPALKEDVIKVRSGYDLNLIAQFEALHGSITDNRNLIHFLLKYRYTDNWEREVNENYLPVSVEDVMSRISGGGAQYRLIYFDHYILPFLARSVKKDFDIVLKDYTHVKFIYELR